MFTVFIEKRAIKDLAGLPQFEQQRILRKIDVILVKNPYPQGTNPKKLKGQDFFSLRVGNYRALYTIAKNLVMILHIEHRKDVYWHLS